jgi:nucleoside transporter
MTNIYQRLSVMMFLQFFIWGSWFVTMGSFLAANLNSTGIETGRAFSTQSWGAIVAPFIIGYIADRFINAERLLGVLHLAGALLMFMLYQANSFKGFYPVLLVYMICYMPTLALVNSISFRQLDDVASGFARIRVWGTVGWICAGLAISLLFSWDSRAAVEQGLLKNTFLMASVASLVLAMFSMMLPPTPPIVREQKRGDVGAVLGLDAVGLLKDKNFALFFLISVLICIPLAFYYQYASPFLLEIGVENATGKMTIGQMSEVIFMLLLPMFLARYGIKMTLLIGMLAWVLRYLLFAFGSPDGFALALVLGIALHGVCYDFFFVAGQIYADSKAGEAHRSSIQGLITLATYGAGMLIGFSTAGYIADLHVDQGVDRWESIWTFPAAFAFVVAIVFLLAFRDRLPRSLVSETVG